MGPTSPALYPGMTPPHSGGRWRPPCCQSLRKGWSFPQEAGAQVVESGQELGDQPLKPSRAGQALLARLLAVDASVYFCEGLPEGRPAVPAGSC